MTGGPRNGGAHPPRPNFALTVGVTGHRAEALPDGALDAVRGRIGWALDVLRTEALAIAEREGEFFGPEPPALVLVSPLASGTDQLAARAARDRGWALQAILPYASEPYRAKQGPERLAEFDALAAEASCLLELPGDPADPLDAYVMVGRATVAHCDLLIAVWDGLPARGRGGTAETIDLALSAGVPVLHLPVTQDREPLLLWEAFDPTVVTHRGNRLPGRPATAEAISSVLAAILAPPQSEQERDFVRRFLAENDRHRRLRIEYPLLMTLAGVHRLSRKDVSARPAREANRTEWQTYKEECLDCHGVIAPLDQLEEAYGWADRLASHFAQTYRSSHIFNFTLAAAGGLVGLSSLVANTAPLPFAIAEFCIVLAVVVNTIVGSRRCWHQRWLDYRQLAERLRPMRSLKLLGIAAPDPPGTAAEPIAQRWVDWYAACIWRTLGCPVGRLTPSSVSSLARAVSAREFEPQVSYNRRTADKAELFDRRLEVLALGLFMATVVITLSVIIGLVTGESWVNDYSNLTTFLSAGLPVIGTAIFGIRVQGDYGALAARARNTATLIERIAEELRRTDDLSRAADLSEHAARVMLADLGEWRLVNELHELSLG